VKKFLEKITKRIYVSEFFFDFKTLSLGTLLSQFIVIISAPLITRLYTPDVYGLFAIFMAFISVFYQSSCLGYDKSIVIFKNNSDVVKIKLFSLFINIVYFFILFLVFFFFENRIKTFFNIGSLEFWFYLIPFAIFLRGFILILTSIANRVKNYHAMSYMLIIRAVTNVSIVIGLGFFGLNFYGLFVGEFIGSLIVIFFSVYFFKIKLLPYNLKYNILDKVKESINLAKKNKQYAQHLTIPNFLNVLRHLLPLFFLTKFYSKEYAGFFILVLQVVNYPLLFISGAITTIQLRKVSELISNKRDIKIYLAKLFCFLLAIIFFPSLIFKFYGKDIFTFIFGGNWQISGIFVQTLIPSLALKFVVGPFASVLVNTGNFKLNTIWNVFSFLLIFFIFYFYSDKLDIYEMIELFNICNFFNHFLLGLFILFSIKNIKSITN
jgi:O-antigen/teichoic acid export membrane protein